MMSEEMNTDDVQIIDSTTPNEPEVKPERKKPKRSRFEPLDLSTTSSNKFGSISGSSSGSGSSKQIYPKSMDTSTSSSNNNNIASLFAAAFNFDEQWLTTPPTIDASVYGSNQQTYPEPMDISSSSSHYVSDYDMAIPGPSNQGYSKPTPTYDAATVAANVYADLGFAVPGPNNLPVYLDSLDPASAAIAVAQALAESSRPRSQIEQNEVQDWSIPSYIKNDEVKNRIKKYGKQPMANNVAKIKPIVNDINPLIALATKPIWRPIPWDQPSTSKQNLVQMVDEEPYEPKRGSSVIVENLKPIPSKIDMVNVAKTNIKPIAKLATMAYYVHFHSRISSLGHAIELLKKFPKDYHSILKKRIKIPEMVAEENLKLYNMIDEQMMNGEKKFRSLLNIFQRGKISHMVRLKIIVNRINCNFHCMPQIESQRSIYWNTNIPVCHEIVKEYWEDFMDRQNTKIINHKTIPTSKSVIKFQVTEAKKGLTKLVTYGTPDLEAIRYLIMINQFWLEIMDDDSEFGDEAREQFNINYEKYLKIKKAFGIV